VWGGMEELEELPHYDTANDFLSGLEVSELENIRTFNKPIVK